MIFFFVQEWRLENLRDVNLRCCKFITKLPKLWAPNLERLELAGCEKLVKLTELGAPNLGYLKLSECKNLVILPSQLRLKSLDTFYLNGCSSLEKFPNFHPEMECLETLNFEGSGIREVPSSIEHLTKLKELNLYKCKNLGDLPDSIYKLQQLRYLETPIAKLRRTCNSFDGSSGCGFVKMKGLYFRRYEAIIELDLLMKPDYFPALEFINLSDTNIVTIPKSIRRFPRLEALYI